MVLTAGFYGDGVGTKMQLKNTYVQISKNF